MPVTCPNCGSRFLRESQTRDFSEKLNKLRFIAPIRCRDCKTRFITRTIILADLFYARCPKCYRMDLNRWTGQRSEASWWANIKVHLGANPWRCEYCRVNFASFRKRRETFTFSRWKNMNSAQARAEGRAKAAEAEAQPHPGDNVRG